MSKKKLSAKKASPVASSTSNSISLNLVVSTSATPEERRVINYRERMFRLQDGLKAKSLEQKKEIITAAFDVIEEFNRTIAEPDKDFYLLGINLCMLFCDSTPDYHLHATPLLRILLTLLDRATNSELPQSGAIYNFTMDLLVKHIARSVKNMLDTSVGQAESLSFSFEEFFTIFQKFSAHIAYKKTAARNDSENVTLLHQQELDLYNKLIYALAITISTNRFSFTTQVSVWNDISLRLLIKIFNRAEANHLALKWLSYHHMAIAIISTSNPNLDLLFSCFDKLKKLNFFELDFASEQRGSVTGKDIQRQFCMEFMRGIKQVLNYDKAHSTGYFTEQHLKKAIRAIEYIQTKGFLNFIIPSVFDMLAQAPSHKRVESSIKQFFQDNYVYTPQIFVSIFQALSRIPSPNSEILRFFFDYAVAQQLLRPNTPDTKTMLYHLFKAQRKQAKPLQDDIRQYCETAITLGYDDPVAFDGIVYALTHSEPRVDEDTLFYFFNTIQTLPFFASSNGYSAMTIDNLLYWLDAIPIPRYASLKSLLTYIERHGLATPKTYPQIIRIMAQSSESLQAFAIDAPTLYSQYSAYQTLCQAYTTLQNDWNPECFQEPFSDVLTAIRQFSETLVTESEHEQYCPCEKLQLLQVLGTGLTQLNALAPVATLHDVRPNHYYQRIQKELRAPLVDVRTIETVIDDYRTSVEQALQKAKELAEQLSFEAIWEHIKSHDIDKLEKANVCLNRYLANSDDPQHQAYQVAKIQCLINLGYYDQAMAWLGRAKVDFQDKSDRSLLSSFAKCCKKLGQFSTAIAIREQLSDRLNKPKKARDALSIIINRLELAHCHILAEGEAHYQAALAIYADLKTHASLLSSKHLLEIEMRIAECYTKLNQFTDAEQQLTNIPDGHNHPQVLLAFARLYQIQKQFQKAQSIYLTLLKRQDNTETIWRILFKNSYRLPAKDRMVVQEHISALLETASSSTPSKNKSLLREKVMVLIQEERYQEALTTLNTMMQIWGKDESIYIGHAICYRHLQEVDSAIAMLKRFPDYQENRKIVMQLVECYRVKQDETQILACFHLLLTRFQTYTLGYRKAITYYSQHGHIAELNQAWENCRIHCKESILLRDIEHLVRPYCDEKITVTIDENPSLSYPSLDQAMITRLELEDMFHSLDDMVETLREEGDLRERVRKNPRYAPDLFNHVTSSPNRTIEALDLVYPNSFALFKKQELEPCSILLVNPEKSVEKSI